MTGLHVQGNHIVNGSGQTVRLLGADRPANYPCVQNWGIFSGPTDQSSVDAMASWDMTAVRIPLNEDCWLGINQGSNSSAYYGASYQNAIKAYVSELEADNIAPILDLHWSAPGTAQSANQQMMPDADHAAAFWTSVAQTFKGDGAAVFDLYNEPYPDNNNDSTAAWQCWLNGCQITSYSSANGYQDVSYSWQAAGMQSLVNAVRATGATNLILAGGIGWGGILDQFLGHAPSDPTHNLAAGIHIYQGSWCNNQSCWDSQVKPVTQQYPVIVGEFGQNDCGTSFVSPLMTYLDGIGASYLAWNWWRYADVGCSRYPLLTDYNGTPSTGYGQAVQSHLQSLAQTATPVPSTPTPDPGTATPVPPTATSVPPTPTSVLPTATATKAPPTATPLPPTQTPVPTKTAVPTPTSTVSGAPKPAFAYVSAARNPVQQGAWQSLRGMITFGQQMQGVTVIFRAVNSAGTVVFSQAWTGQSFVAGAGQRFTANWSVPGTCPLGSYTFQILVESSAGATYGIDASAAVFQVIVRT
jgi:hypothetical protein